MSIAPRHLVLVSVLALIAGCGDGGGLSPEDVTGIPPGDAVGTAATGGYALEIYTAACHGACFVRNGELTGSACDVGATETASLDVVQQDGAVRMLVDGLVYDRLDGGIDADRSFTIGGYVTARAGAIEALMLASGTLTDTGFVGSATQRARGSSDGVDFDCTSDYELTGRRTR